MTSGLAGQPVLSYWDWRDRVHRLVAELVGLMVRIGANDDTLRLEPLAYPPLLWLHRSRDRSLATPRCRTAGSH
jgi:hypothetical protein